MGILPLLFSVLLPIIMLENSHGVPAVSDHLTDLSRTARVWNAKAHLRTVLSEGVLQQCGVDLSSDIAAPEYWTGIDRDDGKLDEFYKTFRPALLVLIPVDGD